MVASLHGGHFAGASLRRSVVLEVWGSLEIRGSWGFAEVWCVWTWGVGVGVGSVGIGGLGSAGLGSGVGVEGLRLGGGRRVGVGGLGLGSGGCSWYKITLKVLWLVYKYLVVSCAVFNYLVVGLKAPCSWFNCLKVPCSSLCIQLLCTSLYFVLPLYCALPLYFVLP